MKQTKERALLLARSLERTNHINCQPRKLTLKEWKKTLDPNDAKLYGTAGVIGVLSLGAVGLFSFAARQKETAEFVEQPPHDLWSFLGSKQGTLLITSTMKLATAIVSR